MRKRTEHWDHGKWYHLQWSSAQITPDNRHRRLNPSRRRARLLGGGIAAGIAIMASQIAGLGATEGAASIAIAQPRLRQAVYLVPLTNGAKVTGPEATTKRLRFHSTSAVATLAAFTQSAPLNLLPMAGTRATTSGPMKKAHTKRTVGAAARAPMIRLQPVSVTVATGTTANFAASASGKPTPTTQWQLSTNDGATWRGIAGATSSSYSIVGSVAYNGDQFRAVFTNFAGSAKTGDAVLTVTAATTTTTSPPSTTRTVPPSTTTTTVPPSTTTTTVPPSTTTTTVPPSTTTTTVPPSTTTTTTTLPPSTSSPTTGMKLAFSATFPGTQLDTNVWDTCSVWFNPATGCTNFGNPQEEEWYLPGQDQVSDGVLHLVATETPTLGTDSSGAPKTYPYTSGMVTTRPSFQFTYGYVQIVATIPGGTGTWPALWLVAADNSWPPEIDIMENWGSTNTVSDTVHWGSSQDPQQQSTQVTSSTDLTNGWHTYGLAWEPGSLTWYLDGKVVDTFTGSNVPSQAMYLIANLAIDGPAASGASFNIQSVQIWQS